MKVVIIDYGLCNLLSVYNALKFIGINSNVSAVPEELKTADIAILPGVGAFEDGMQGMRKRGLINAVYDFVKTGRPFLGICLGMQLLMSKSYEFGEHEGLGLIKGEVLPFKTDCESSRYRVKVPHIGWNKLYPKGCSWDGTILSSLDEGIEMYFVHSFYVSPSCTKNILAETEYAGTRFCSVVFKDNIYGCQFHPEKSARFGLKILENFVRLQSTVTVSTYVG